MRVRDFFVVLFSFSHAYTLNMIATSASKFNSMLSLVRGELVLLPFFHIYINIFICDLFLISFVSLFPLWNKSENDSKEQVAFRLTLEIDTLKSYITIFHLYFCKMCLRMCTSIYIFLYYYRFYTHIHKTTHHDLCILTANCSLTG